MPGNETVVNPCDDIDDGIADTNDVKIGMASWGLSAYICDNGLAKRACAGKRLTTT